MYSTFSREKVEDMSNLLGGQYSFQFVTNFWWNMYDIEREVVDEKYIQIYNQVDELLASKLHSLYFSDSSVLQEIVCCSRDYRATLFFYGIDLIHTILFSSNEHVEDLFLNLFNMRTQGVPSIWCLFERIGNNVGLRYLLPKNRWYNKVWNLEVVNR